MRHRIFVGSSTEDLTLANAIQLNLSRQGHTVKVWDQGVFTVGKNILEGLIHALDDYDAAVFVFAPNDLVSIRGQHFDAVRDNVVFELGLFTGKLGRDRTFWVVPQGQKQLRLASDLLGVVPAEYVEPRSGVEPLPDGTGYRLELSRKADLRVSFGRIEECRYDEAGSVIVPPANEFFDDACITDHKSALGAFVKHHFDGQVDDFTKLVAKGRATLPPPKFAEREEGLYQESYGVGTSLWLDRPLGSKCPLILCAVTRKRAGEGIRAEPAYVFAGMHTVSRVMNDHKLTDLHVPLLGSGHGDMASEVAVVSGRARDSALACRERGASSRSARAGRGRSRAPRAGQAAAVEGAVGADRDALRSRCDLGQAALELGSPNYGFVRRYLEVVPVQTGSALSSAAAAGPAVTRPRCRFLSPLRSGDSFSIRAGLSRRPWGRRGDLPRVYRPRRPKESPLFRLPVEINRATQMVLRRGRGSMRGDRWR